MFIQKTPKFIEYLFFIILNIIFSFSFLGYGIFLLLLLPVIPMAGVTAELTDGVIFQYAIACIFIDIVYVIVKLFILPVLFLLKNLLPNIHIFLEKILDNRSFRYKILFIVLLSDLIYFLLNSIYSTPFLAGNFKDAKHFTVIHCGGMLPAYIIFIAIFKIKNTFPFTSKIPENLFNK